MTRRINPSREFKGIKFFNVRELSQILQITEYSVRSYLRKGKMPSVVVGQKLWVSEKDLESFLTCKGIRALGDEQLISMVNRAIELKYQEWTDRAIPKMQKIVADFLLKKEKERDKERAEFKEEMKLVYSLNEMIKKVLPKKTIEAKKDFEKVKV